MQIESVVRAWSLGLMQITQHGTIMLEAHTRATVTFNGMHWLVQYGKLRVEFEKESDAVALALDGKMLNEILSIQLKSG